MGQHGQHAQAEAKEKHLKLAGEHARLKLKLAVAEAAVKEIQNPREAREPPKANFDLQKTADDPYAFGAEPAFPSAARRSSSWGSATASAGQRSTREPERYGFEKPGQGVKRRCH